MIPLLERLLRDMSELDLRVALHHGEFAAVSAQMEHNGVPIDEVIFRQLADKDTWREIRDAMVPRVDAKYGVYVQGPSGLSFNMDRFGEYLEREGIDWPRTDKGALITRQKVFEGMCKAWPQLEDLRQLRHVRNKMRKIKLAVGPDGRNRTVLWPFQSKTSRTQPKAAQWIFSPAVWLRSLIKPEPGTAVAYIDYSAMEFLIAAVLSDKHCGPVNRPLDAYNSGDPYLAFAKQVGAVPRNAVRDASTEAVRDNYKIVGLGTLYGMQEESLASRTGLSRYAAGELLRQHQEEFASQYWRWSDDWLQRSLQSGRMRTAMGWTCHVGVLEKNDRSIRNWPIQTSGADILRIACVWAARRGIRLLAPVHDAVLIEAPIERIEADVELMREIMRRASRVVLNATADGPHELRTDFGIVRHPDRYMDKRGVKFWEMVMELLVEVKRAREEDAA
jgi:DNA polymerase I